MEIRIVGKLVNGTVVYYDVPNKDNKATSKCEMCGRIKYTSECACEH